MTLKKPIKHTKCFYSECFTYNLLLSIRSHFYFYFFILFLVILCVNMLGTIKEADSQTQNQDTALVGWVGCA